MSKFYVTILWGENPGPETDLAVYSFKTLEERKAFLQGVEQSLGWQGVDWRIHDVPRKFKKEEFDNYIGGNYE